MFVESLRLTRSLIAHIKRSVPCDCRNLFSLRFFALLDHPICWSADCSPDHVPRSDTVLYTAHILMSSDLSLLCLMSPHLSSRLDLSQSRYATRHWKGLISSLILCVRLSYDCIPCSICIDFFEHGWVVKTRFLYYISCHNIRWMIWSFLIIL